MKYYLIVGEASGDLHASNLMKSLKRHDSEAEFRFYGGDKMAAVGGTLVKHYKELAYPFFCTHKPFFTTWNCVRKTSCSGIPTLSFWWIILGSISK